MRETNRSAAAATPRTCANRVANGSSRASATTRARSASTPAIKLAYPALADRLFSIGQLMPGGPTQPPWRLPSAWRSRPPPRTQ
ncbi:hypothetical protein Mkiyose1088_43320 [Mycobacterium kiyosense]|uniref:Uncharacterized protein n=1 Tax=Mycobacterium kiyosense TaxID=2871094 RepID=A0A9P3QDU9_9MYCO|nr:hypothetical protein IWGMT90018_26450 [Mycobacterium kiyosense]BDE14526.1 hypothetical protein MKCMC460_33860 [Mycobacterium sp. 20KCMC460]GLB92400.1 hypothetical protein SRL2020130_52170 [Mycobacterium kiyosense]GLC10662.1 hypothetical protein SRL2020411_53080 [Mycobacterium kiyosense]GLC16644.1 hypothetical protein SRL2020448_52470 [Mycobacterium kiyosense]